MLNRAFSYDNPKEKEPSETVAIPDAVDQEVARILSESERPYKFKNGIPVLQSKGEVVTSEQIHRIMEEESI